MGYTKEVYKSAQGWVRQWEDGAIVGPFETIDEAKAAKHPAEAKAPEPAFSGKKYSRKQEVD